MKQIAFIDLFAGIGGIRLPFDELGYKCVFPLAFQNLQDEKPAGEHRKNFAKQNKNLFAPLEAKDEAIPQN